MKEEEGKDKRVNVRKDKEGNSEKARKEREENGDGDCRMIK